MSNLSTFIGGGSSTRLWTSGETVTQWDYRKSLLDGDTYQRFTATGSGTTDPADDVTNWLAKSFTRVTAIPNAVVGPQQNGSNPVFSNSNYFALGSVKPALTAAATGVRTLQLSLTGRGTLGFFGLCRVGSGNLRVEIIVDGRAVLDVTSTFAASDCAVYFGAAPYGVISGQPINFATAIFDAAGIPFRQSLQIYMTPVTGTLTTSDYLAYSMRSER